MSQMYQIALVALGGAIGSVVRYAVSAVMLSRAVDWSFPIGTFVVNIVGCFVVGLLGALAVEHELLSAHWQVFLFTGVAGGFTTFSAFGLETFDLLRRGELLVAGGYIAASVLLGLVAVWLGFSVISSRAM